MKRITKTIHEYFEKKVFDFQINPKTRMFKASSLVWWDQKIPWYRILIPEESRNAAIEWVIENTSGPWFCTEKTTATFLHYRVWFHDQEMSFFFIDEQDIILFKMRWL